MALFQLHDRFHYYWYMAKSNHCVSSEENGARLPCLHLALIPLHLSLRKIVSVSIQHNIIIRAHPRLSIPFYYVFDYGDHFMN